MFVGHRVVEQVRRHGLDRHEVGPGPLDQVLRDAGAIIIAHKNVRGWVRTNNINLFGDRITPALKAKVEALPLPDVATDGDLTIWLGSRKVVVKTVLGHTGGDLVVSVPDVKVLFAGDMLWRKVAPNLIDGSVEEWSATAGDFVRWPDASQTQFVPGHGDVADSWVGTGPNRSSLPTFQSCQASVSSSVVLATKFHHIFTVSPRGSPPSSMTRAG